MSELFNPPKMPTIPAPPAPPSPVDPAIANRAAEEARLRQAGGRASQMLTNPQMNAKASPDATRYLGGR